MDIDESKSLMSYCYLCIMKFPGSFIFHADRTAKSSDFFSQMDATGKQPS